MVKLKLMGDLWCGIQPPSVTPYGVFRLSRLKYIYIYIYIIFETGNNTTKYLLLQVSCFMFHETSSSKYLVLFFPVSNIYLLCFIIEHSHYIIQLILKYIYIYIYIYYIYIYISFNGHFERIITTLARGERWKSIKGSNLE